MYLMRASPAAPHNSESRSKNNGAEQKGTNAPPSLSVGFGRTLCTHTRNRKKSRSNEVNERGEVKLGLHPRIPNNAWSSRARFRSLLFIGR